MSCTYNYKGKDYTEAGLIEVLSKDPKIVEKYFPKEERYSEDYTREDITRFKAKIAHLQRSMNVKVIMDPNIESSRLLGSADKRVKDEGRPVILINPNQLFTTTAIHEFGHVFIDSFPGGMSNPRLVRAYKMLENTPMYSEIKELYPELNDEMFQKELITTAIGREGAEIFDSQEDISVWQSIKEWFLSFVNRTFNIQSNEIEMLTKELLDTGIKKYTAISDISLTDQELRDRTLDKESKEEKEDIKTLESVYSQMITRVTNIYNEYIPKTAEARNKEYLNQEERVTRFQSITELKEALEKLDKTDRKLGLSKYIKWVSEEIGAVSKFTDERIRTGSINDKKIMASIEWNQAFSTIDDIQGLVIQLHKEGDLTDSDKNYYDRKLTKIQGNRSKLESKLLNAAREQYAKFMSENDNKIKAEYEDMFEKEYDKKELKSSGISKDKYVLEKMQESNEEIQEKAYSEALERAEKSVSDIHGLAAKMWSEKNANSQDIQVLSTLVDSVESQIQSYSLTEATEMDTSNKLFKEEVSNDNNQSKKYEGLFSTSESGQSYFASQYKPEFIEKKSEMMNIAFDNVLAQEKYGEVEIVGSKLNYTIDGKKKQIKFGDATKYKLEGVHLSYELIGERVHIPVAEAIARSEYESWITENTESVIIKGESRFAPIQKWVNNDYNSLSTVKKKHLNFLKERVRDADEMTSGSHSLITRTFNQEFIRLPGMLKSDIQRVAEGDVVGAMKHQLSEITAVQKDDFETETGRTENGSIKVFANISNQEKMRVPIPFRSKLSADEQSFDLHTMVLMNSVSAKNYEKKKEIESTFLVVLEVMKNRKVPDKHGLMGLKKIHANSEDNAELFKDPRNGLPNDAKRALDTLENRIYGIKSKDAGEVKIGSKKMNINQLTKSWLKYSGTTALVGNWINSVVNLNMGTINNMIEAMGGEHFNWNDWGKAGKTYWKDVKNIKNDWGSNVDRSRTNMLMQAFNVMGDKKYLDNNFEENTRAQSLLKMNSLRPIAKAGEHMMQAKVMYAVMHNIKAMNKNGDYIDSNGKVVKTKKQAASMNDMISFDKTSSGGVEMKLNKHVGATSFTKSGDPDQILLETKNLIKYKVRELHGNYDSDIQAAAQMEFWGKLVFFLRKWVEEGYFRRWRGTGTIHKKQEDLTEADRFYSQDAKGNREGYYVTSTRFLTRVLLPGITQMKIDLIKTGFGNLTAHEKANLKKTLMELGMIVTFMLAYASMGDDDELLTERYIMRRQLAELGFFASPGEAIKIVQTPTAAVGTLNKLMKIASQSYSPTETFKQGSNKGRNKLGVSILKAFPLVSQTEKDTKASLNFLESSNF